MELEIFAKMRLTGGTALTLQLGHRKSIDLDFFGEIEYSGREIFETLNNNFDVFIKSDSNKIHNNNNTYFKKKKCEEYTLIAKFIYLIKITKK
jgi:hypothetical protein